MATKTQSSKFDALTDGGYRLWVGCPVLSIVRCSMGGPSVSVSLSVLCRGFCISLLGPGSAGGAPSSSS